MRYETKLGSLLFCAALLLGGCASEPTSPTPKADPVAPAPSSPEPETTPPVESEAAPAPPSEPAPAVPPAPTPVSAVVDPGGVIEVAATKPGLSRVGSEKCELCHKVQFASWAETAHATRTPPLDCEGCHGPGSEYQSMAVMKDPEKAKAAGLVMPDRAFCSTCHESGWTDDLLTRAHAHKADGS